MIRTWFPDYSQIAVVERKYTSYFYSLWVGLTAPILNLPVMIWNEILVPVLDGVITVVTGTIMSVLAGIVGLAAGLVEHPEDDQV